tara:strand:+ start:69 stop:1532 length:1464 start_codon:yes stop_codon:yes gene_type:complete
MPTLGEGFLESLRNPPVNQGLFNLGAAVGGVPGQYRAKQKKDTRAAELLNVAQGSSEFYTLLSKHALEDGDTLKAAELNQTSKRMQREKVLEGREDTEYSDEQASKTADSAYRLTTLADVLKRTDLTQTQKTKATRLQASLTAAKGKEGEALKKSYDNFIAKVAPEVYTKKDYTSLLKDFTPESINKFRESVNSGTPNDGLLVLRPVKGSKASPKVVTIKNATTGVNEEFAIRYDDNDVLQKIKIGESEETDDGDSNLDSKWGSDLLTETRDEAKVAKIRELSAKDLSEFVNNRTFYQRGLLGDIVSSAKEKAGLADYVTEHRKRINKIRASNALDLLPAGPASDKDVAIAMTASIDPNDLDNETAKSYFRGLEKIAAAEKEYYENKSAYIQYTEDANAVGFEDWVAKTTARKELAYYEREAGESVAAVKTMIADANLLSSPADRQKALENITTTFPDIVGSMFKLQQAEEFWEETVKRKPKLKGMR